MICVGPNDNNRTCEDYGVNIWYEVNVFPNYNKKFSFTAEHKYNNMPKSKF